MPSFHSLIHRKIVVLSSHATLREAARAMEDNLIGCVLVSGPQGGIGGIVTDRDLTCRWLTEEGLGAVADANATIDQLMSRHLIVADENAGLEDILQLMETHGVRRIPIVNTRQKSPQQKFVGIITLDDLISAELVAPARIARIIQRQLKQKIESLGTSERSLAHQKQTLQRFDSQLGQATGLSPEKLHKVATLIIGALITRVTLTAGMHFLAQLPERIREPLLALPLGPEKHVTAQSLLKEMCETLKLTEPKARHLLQAFIAELSLWMGHGQLDHLRAQLPTDFQTFFENKAAA